MELTDTHLETLTTIAGGPTEADIDPDVLADFRKWGMVMQRSLEVTGMGSRFLGGAKGGVLE